MSVSTTSILPSYDELLLDWKIQQAKKVLENAKKERKALLASSSSSSAVAAVVLKPYMSTSDASVEEPPLKRRKIASSTDDGLEALTSAFASLKISDTDDTVSVTSHKPHLLKAGYVYSINPNGIGPIIKSIQDGTLKSQTPSVSWSQGTKHHPLSTIPAHIIKCFQGQRPMDLKTACDTWGVYGDKTVSAAKFKDYLRELIKQGIIVSNDTKLR